LLTNKTSLEQWTRANRLALSQAEKKSPQVASCVTSSSNETRLLFEFDGSSYLFLPAPFDYEVVLVSCMLLNLEHQESFGFCSAFPVTSFVSSVAAFKRKEGRLRFCFHENILEYASENIFIREFAPIRYLGYTAGEEVQKRRKSGSRWGCEEDLISKLRSFKF
jgi:hypothetical protein